MTQLQNGPLHKEGRPPLSNPHKKTVPKNPSLENTHNTEVELSLEGTGVLERFLRKTRTTRCMQHHSVQKCGYQTMGAATQEAEARARELQVQSQPKLKIFKRVSIPRWENPCLAYVLNPGLNLQ